MNKLMILCLLLVFGPSSFAAFSVDKKESKITWTGSKVIGSEHTGHVGIQEANLNWNKDELSGGNIVINMTEITNTDLKDAKSNKKLVGHLKSDDFFGVSKHKTATLEIKNVKKVSKNKYKIMGDLVIKGTKKPVTVDAEVKKSTKSMKTVMAKFKFDRTQFGIKYGSGKFFEDLGDKMISDDVEVAVELVLNKKNKS